MSTPCGHADETVSRDRVMRLASPTRAIYCDFGPRSSARAGEPSGPTAWAKGDVHAAQGGAICPMVSFAKSVNHTAPSGPVVIPVDPIM